MAPAKIKLDSSDDYLAKLRTAHVVADMQERKKMLEERIARVARELGGRILPDEELVDINNNLVEFPIAVAGKFDTEFLEVPDEVLINVMREHQKY
ncbi:MAG: glycine--tRNA ligase subunit beta, partial [Deltaproteobacteria bacterium]|nr:glycine--tRNA ligase subunit beta [Deltaproteobacteria bacterium]